MVPIDEVTEQAAPELRLESARARSVRAHPASWNRKLSRRVDSIHQMLLHRTRSREAHQLEFSDHITLRLDGDLDARSAPHLQSVLDAVAFLQPQHLIVDLSQVGRVSGSALRMIERCGTEVGGLSLLSPSSRARSDLVGLGTAELSEPSTPDVDVDVDVAEMQAASQGR